MFPELISIGGVTLHSYGMMLAIGVITAYFLLIRTGKFLGLEAATLSDAATGAVISGIIGARLLYIFLNLNNFLSRPLSVFYLWEGGLVFLGGFLGGLIWLIYFSKKKNIPLLTLFDSFAPSLPLAHAFGRIGCFLAGCCWGIHTESFLGVRFSHPKTLCETELSVHPVQLYSAIFLFILSYLLFRYIKKRKFPGSAAALYFTLYGAFRFFIEFMRGDDRGRGLMGLSTTQNIAILMFISGLILFRRLRSERS